MSRNTDGFVADEDGFVADDGFVPDAPDAPPTGPQVSQGQAITRGLERGLWSLPALATGGLLSMENFEAGTKWVGDKLSGGDANFSDLREKELELSRAAEKQNPWTTGITRGLGQAPGDALLTVATAGAGKVAPLLNEAAGPLVKFLAMRAKDGTLKARQIANAVTQGVRQFGTGTATSVAPTIEGKVGEGLVSGAVAAPLGAMAPTPVKTALEPELSGLATRAGKQAVKAHRATDTDLGNLQNKHGTGTVGDEALAGLKVLEQKLPNGEPVLPFWGSPEQLSKNWDAVAEASGRSKAATVAAVDEARPQGAVDVAEIVTRSHGEAAPLRTDATRAVYGDAPKEDANSFLRTFIQRYGLGKRSLADIEDFKSTLQRYVNETGSQKNPVRPRQAIDNDPSLRFRRSVSGVAREEGEKAVQDVLGPEAATKFKADKESYGLAEDFGRYAHNAYNKTQAKTEGPKVAHKWDLIRRAEDLVARTHAPRARAYHAADEVLSGSNPVAGAAALNSGAASQAPVTVGTRGMSAAVLDYLRAKGLIE